MEPENGPLEKEIPIGNHHFQVPCEFFGVYIHGFFFLESTDDSFPRSWMMFPPPLTSGSEALREATSKLLRVGWLVRGPLAILILPPISCENSSQLTTEID